MHLINTDQFQGNGCRMQPFSFYCMKKFIVFILFILLLIVSEYFLLNELFAAKRVSILLLSLLGTVFCIYAVIKFFKKYILHSKQPEAHS